jgi:acetamidase/formamidase
VFRPTSATTTTPTPVQPHNQSGPIAIKDEAGVPAQPGDLLVVEICDIGPLHGDEWGFTGIFDRENGGGFLTDHFPNACKVGAPRPAPKRAPFKTCACCA